MASKLPYCQRYDDPNRLPATRTTRRYGYAKGPAMTLGFPAATGMTIVATYGTATFLQAFLHWRLGHHRLGRWFFRSHMECHHAIYAGAHLASDRYEDEKISLTPFYVAPVGMAGWLTFEALPRELFLVHAATFVAVFALHVHIHKQFHLEQSWLNRFGVFQRRRRLHDIHHLNPQKNFAVLEPLWDHVFGTYQARMTSTVESR